MPVVDMDNRIAEDNNFAVEVRREDSLGNNRAEEASQQGCCLAAVVVDNKPRTELQPWRRMHLRHHDEGLLFHRAARVVVAGVPGERLRLDPEIDIEIEELGAPCLVFAVVWPTREFLQNRIHLDDDCHRLYS